MNYNSMAGQPPPGPMPNGHHAMPPQQMNPAAGAADDQSQMSAQPDPSSDPFRSQQMNPQFNNQQGMRYSCSQSSPDVIASIIPVPVCHLQFLL